jgi:hypothetical protein
MQQLACSLYVSGYDKWWKLLPTQEALEVWIGNTNHAILDLL